MKTTLNKIKAFGPCDDGWKKLLAFLNKTEADDEELSLLTILESNGIDHAIWALKTVDGYDREIRLFACDCAEHALPIFEARHPDDKRPRNAIETARRYANGDATIEELGTAYSAAHSAAYSAANSAAYSAWYSAANSAARSAAYLAAYSAAYLAANSAAYSAAEREYQKELFIKLCEESK